MLRKDREVTDFKEMLEIMKICDCCRLGLEDEYAPYIVPLNFGYEADGENLCLYFHGSLKGKKIELVKKRGFAAFETDTCHGLSEGSNACDYSFLYKSIIGKGKIQLLSNNADKIKGLNAIMHHYSNKAAWEYNEKALDNVAVIKLQVTEWSCKKHQ